MKTKDLIKQLQELDPEGNMIIDGVYFCEKLPYYYDGASYDIVRDESTNNKLTMVIDRKIDKIRIHNIDIDNICEFHGYNKEEILKYIDMSNLNEIKKNEYIKIIDRYILENEELIKEMKK